MQPLQAPSDTTRRRSVRARAVTACLGVLAATGVIMGVTGVASHIHQSWIDRQTTELSQPASYKTVTANDIIKEAGDHNPDWNSVYDHVPSKINSMEYDVTIMDNGDLKVSQYMEVQNDKHGDELWSQIYQLIPVSPERYKSIKGISVENLSSGEGLTQTNYSDPAESSSDEWNERHAGKWFLGIMDKNAPVVKGNYIPGDDGTAILGVNMDRVAQGTASIRFNYVLTPGNALQVHDEGTTSLLFDMIPDGSNSTNTPIKSLDVTVHRPSTDTADGAWIDLAGAADPSWKVTQDEVTFHAGEILSKDLPTAVITVPTPKLDLPDDVSHTGKTPETLASEVLTDGAGFPVDGMVNGGEITQEEAEATARRQTEANRKTAEEQRTKDRQDLKDKEAQWRKTLAEGNRLVKIVIMLTAVGSVLVFVLSHRVRNRKALNDLTGRLVDPMSDDRLDPLQRAVISTMMVKGETEPSDLTIIDAVLNVLAQASQYDGNDHLSEDGESSPMTWAGGWCSRRIEHGSIRVYPGPSVIYRDFDAALHDKISTESMTGNDDHEDAVQHTGTQSTWSRIFEIFGAKPNDPFCADFLRAIDEHDRQDRPPVQPAVPEDQLDALLDLAKRHGIDVDSTVTVQVDPSVEGIPGVLEFSCGSRERTYRIEPVLELLTEWMDGHDGRSMFDLDELMQTQQAMEGWDHTPLHKLIFPEGLFPQDSSKGFYLLVWSSAGERLVHMDAPEGTLSGVIGRAKAGIGRYAWLFALLPLLCTAVNAGVLMFSPMGTVSGETLGLIVSSGAAGMLGIWLGMSNGLDQNATPTMSLERHDGRIQIIPVGQWRRRSRSYMEDHDPHEDLVYARCGDKTYGSTCDHSRSPQDMTDVIHGEDPSGLSSMAG